MSDPTALTMAGVAVVPLIVALVEVAKGFGLPARWGAGLAVVLGIAASLGYQATGPDWPDPRDWANALIVGLALGLAASGLYSGARAAATNRGPAV